jgi:hypothetical protein
MTALREAAQLAVTMLKTGMPEYDLDDVLEVLEAALAETTTENSSAVEPVAWMYTGIKCDGGEHGPHLVWKPAYMDAMSAGKGAKATPLYAAPPTEEHPCNAHPKAPHGFMRNASHTEDRYVCECEAWDPYEAGYQAGMESAMRMEAESAHILGANPDSSQDTGSAP